MSLLVFLFGAHHTRDLSTIFIRNAVVSVASCLSKVEKSIINKIVEALVSETRYPKYSLVQEFGHAVVPGIMILLARMVL